MTRMYDDLSKMAFWSVVMGTVFNHQEIKFPVTDHEIANIHVDENMTVSDISFASDINHSGTKW